ncbi:cytochrome c [uncultured Maribacter sp.]|uniref:c-type cytochrome n=1 Tax=uncultured Maribacter sp. TaxID=431308 RepID=UPI002621BF7B|nr:cytochrome c [uncultured Maribacter sp.]
MKFIITVFLFFIASNISFSQEKSTLQESMLRGEEIYADFCVSCHLKKGKGFAKIYPPLAKSDYLLNNRTESIKAILYGLQGEIVVNGKTYNNSMPSQGLEPEEVADVMNYILNTWENSSDKIVTPEEVSLVTE